MCVTDLAKSHAAVLPRNSDLTSINLAKTGRACFAISMAALALMKLWMNIVYMFIRWHFENYGRERGLVLIPGDM